MPPCLVPTRWWWPWVSGHFSVSTCSFTVRCVCGVGVFIFFPSWLCCSVKFQNSPQTYLWGVSYCVETSPSRLPPQDRSWSLNLLSLFLSFVFCPTSFWRDCWLSGCLVSSARVQKLFCGSCSTFKWSFDAFVGEKVVSWFYYSTI